VKRTYALALGAAVLGTAALLAGRADAQGPAGAQQPGASAGTRIATLNIAVVTKGYKKFDIFTKEMEELERPFREKAKTYAERYKQWDEVARNPTTKDEERDKAQKYLVDLKRMMEDNQAAAGKALSARRNEKLVQLYREIQEKAGTYAQLNGIHVVLQYYEPLSPTDVYSPANIDRKLKGSAAGAYTPLYLANGVDISEDVVRLLNAPFTAAAAPAAGGGAQ
jgi:Skp family chaperone for outer membrane proteins